MKALIISGFPGIGKTRYKEVSNQLVLDLDTSNFDKEEFPKNYLDEIEDKIESYNVILVSTHREVREGLLDRGINFTLVYPNIELKEEYVDRYQDRGSEVSFINLLESNWDEWINELEEQERCSHIVLNSNEFLTDIMNIIT